MDKHELGIKGEKLAVSFLKRRGYFILEQNYRFGRAEIDIICKKGNWIIFVEVKTRSSLAFGFPEEHVHPAQISRIRKAAEEYLEKLNPSYENVLIRFDVISIHWENLSHSLSHFEDAFY